MKMKKMIAVPRKKAAAAAASASSFGNSTATHYLCTMLFVRTTIIRSEGEKNEKSRTTNKAKAAEEKGRKKTEKITSKS